MKKNRNAIMLVFLIAIVYIYYIEMLPLRIDATNLAASYSKNKNDADNNFLNKELEVTGTVKAFYTLLDVRAVLELNTNESEVSLFCFFMNEIDENDAARFNQGDTITIIGKCAGLNKYNFVNGVKIDVKRIK